MKTIAQQLNVTEFPFRIKDKKGNQIYFEDSYGYWYKWEYDSNRNTIYHEDSNKFWYKREYDSNGKLIYFENSNGDKIYSENSTGCWWKYKYDSNRNLIYFEDSDGLWAKWEYDSDGNEIYYEDSCGDIEDKRPKPTLDWSRSLYDTVTRPNPCENKVVEIDGIKYKLVKA
jgi:hypothetical protein